LEYVGLTNTLFLLLPLLPCYLHYYYYYYYYYHHHHHHHYYYYYHYHYHYHYHYYGSMSTDVLEILMVSQLVKKFPAINGKLRLITLFTIARHFSYHGSD
jgi:hypothetical protein